MTADFNAWLSAHGRRIAIVVLWVVGAFSSCAALVALL
jgi:hypothetical protein